MSGGTKQVSRMRNCQGSQGFFVHPVWSQSVSDATNCHCCKGPTIQLAALFPMKVRRGRTPDENTELRAVIVRRTAWRRSRLLATVECEPPALVNFG